MIVVDANVALPLIREDALSESARDTRSADADWVVPPLLKVELANALLKDVNAKFLAMEGAEQAAETASVIFAKARVLDPPIADVLRVARQSGLTAYDASYVVLARSMGILLVTEDKQILRACPDVARSMKQFLAPPDEPRSVRERSQTYRTRKPKRARA